MLFGRFENDPNLSFMGKLRHLLGIVAEDMGTYQLWRVGSPVARCH